MEPTFRFKSEELIYNFLKNAAFDNFEANELNMDFIDINRSNILYDIQEGDKEIDSYVYQYLETISKDDLEVLKKEVPQEFDIFIDFETDDEFNDEEAKIEPTKKDVADFLGSLYANFASEFDFSDIDEESAKNVKALMVGYK